MAAPDELIKRLYNAFDPFRPLPAGDPAYVDCRAVRGDGEILIELGREIVLADRITHQLYTGHRGAGKSTELLRLTQYLRGQGFRVVYFAADEEDIDKEDAQYTDIRLACTRHLLAELKGGQDNPIWKWLQLRMQALSELLQSEITLDDISVESQIVQFAKLTATLKASPDTRAKIRRMVEPHTVSLIEALNQFITDAMAKTPERSTQKLVVIADNLDRITPIAQTGSSPSNHDTIFIDRSEQLQALKCHVIYTVPISLVYSSRATDLRDIYDTEAQVLPMVMVRQLSGEIYPPGLAALKEVISKRVYASAKADISAALVGGVFDTEETLNQLCLMSGGHVRNLMLLTKEAVKRNEVLPISERAVRRAITEARNTYRNTITSESQWSLLAQVHQKKDILDEAAYRELLFNRCILEYRYINDRGEVCRWRDVHPLIRGIQQFQDALAALST